MQLTKHFALDEFTRSQTAARKGIDNTPPPEVVERLTALCTHVLEPIREHFQRPVRVSSGYRSSKLNKAIGGSTTSQHCKGEAADFTVPGVANLELANWIHRNLDYDQLIYEFGEWVHVSWTPDYRNQELTAKRVGGRTKYLPGIVA